MERMLINATHKEEIRVAMVNGNDHLSNLDIEKPSNINRKATKGNVYKGVVTRVEKSLEAAFVEFGSKRQGFLPLKEISPEYFDPNVKAKQGESLSINQLIKEGQELMIQVDKEERGNKGAAITTYITLAGCYLVLMPNNPRSGGISRRIEGDEREELKDLINRLNVPQNMGVIVRTAGLGKAFEELQFDMDALLNQWKAIKAAYGTQPAPFLIHQEGDVIIRSIRDNLRKSVDEIIIDQQEAYIKAKAYIERVKPDYIKRLKLYNDSVPLFSRYKIESQIESAYQREVVLPSGGSIVIDRTEALVSIDINSAKATSGSDIETTALNTNLEAADEIARQLRIRDLGGLVVIDFIDMSASKNQREVENRLRDALKSDRARIQIGRISRFGLLEMSRQRLRLSLGESSQVVCPQCDGRGTVRSVQSHALSMIRLVEEAALQDNIGEIQVQLPVEMSTFLFNEKRDEILAIEKRHGVNVVILSNPYMQIPNYKLAKIKLDNSGNLRQKKKASYELIQDPELKMIKGEHGSADIQEPAIKHFALAEVEKEENVGFIKRLWNSLFGESEEKEQPEQTKSNTQRRPNQRHRKNPRHKNKNQQQQRHGKSSGGQANQRHHSNKRRPQHNRNQNQQRHKKQENKVVPLKGDEKKK